MGPEPTRSRASVAPVAGFADSQMKGRSLASGYSQT